MNTIVFLIYTVFVTFVSLRPIGNTAFGNWDKVGHLILYCIFAAIGYYVVSNSRHYLYLCSGIVGYGCLMEIAQSFTPGRMMSGYDMLANAVGVAIAIVFTRMTFGAKNS
ncbi:MAG: VanZ family protein [Oceanicoccus sp.]